MRNDTNLSFWHIVKKPTVLKLKIMSITCRLHVFDFNSVDLVYFVLAYQKSFLGVVAVPN